MHLTKTGYLASANNNRIKKMFQKTLIVCFARKAVCSTKCLETIKNNKVVNEIEIKMFTKSF
jgi:hypothetical protein